LIILQDYFLKKDLDPETLKVEGHYLDKKCPEGGLLLDCVRGQSIASLVDNCLKKGISINLKKDRIDATIGANIGGGENLGDFIRDGFTNVEFRDFLFLGKEKGVVYKK